MKESEGKRKEARELKASRQKETFINGEHPFTVLVWGFYIAPAKQNYKKNQNQKLLHGIKWEENQKGEQKLTSQTGSRKEQSTG